MSRLRSFFFAEDELILNTKLCRTIQMQMMTHIEMLNMNFISISHDFWLCKQTNNGCRLCRQLSLHTNASLNLLNFFRFKFEMRNKALNHNSWQT